MICDLTVAKKNNTSAIQGGVFLKKNSGSMFSDSTVAKKYNGATNQDRTFLSINSISVLCNRTAIMQKGISMPCNDIFKTGN